MPEHNGDFSPEAERKRKLKREKVQRSRIRKRIEAGTATPLEIAAIDAWELGEEWSLEAREPAQSRPVRARSVAQNEQEEEIAGAGGWGTLIGAAVVIAVCIGAAILGARGGQG